MFFIFLLRFHFIFVVHSIFSSYCTFFLNMFIFCSLFFSFSFFLEKEKGEWKHARRMYPKSRQPSRRCDSNHPLCPMCGRSWVPCTSAKPSGPDGCWERLGKRAVCLLHHLPPEYPNADASRVTKNRRRAQAGEGGGRLVPGA